MKKVTLIARNAQGASVEFHGKSKAEALREFRQEYETKGFKFQYVDNQTGQSI